MLFMSSAFGVVGWFIEPIFLTDYWHPTMIFTSSFTFNSTTYQLGSIEGIIFSFLIGGIASVVYEVFVGKYFKSRRIRKHNWILWAVSLLTLNVAVLMISTSVGINSIYAAILSCLACFCFYIFFSKDLIVDSLLSGLLMGCISLLVLLTWHFIFFGIFDAWWQRENLSGISILGIPIEEPLLYFTLGAVLGPLYEFLLGLRFRRTIQLRHGT